MADRRVLLYNGETFEFSIMDLLRAEFPEMQLLHDLRVYSYFLGKDTQVDLVAISANGVFVIEAKNWKYWVSGDYDDMTWTGKSRDNHIMTVFNPIYQNFIHVRALRAALRRAGFCPGYWHNLVVVPDGTSIKSPCREVMNLSRLPDWVRHAVPLGIDVAECARQIKMVTR